MTGLLKNIEEYEGHFIMRGGYRFVYGTGRFKWHRTTFLGCNVSTKPLIIIFFLNRWKNFFLSCLQFESPYPCSLQVRKRRMKKLIKIISIFFFEKRLFHQNLFLKIIFSSCITYLWHFYKEPVRNTNFFYFLCF